jgi:hypothetical protein
MEPATDNRIEAFRVTVDRLGIVLGQLHALAVTIARAEELPGLIARTSYPIERQQLAEEQAVIGHPVGLRIRQSQLDSELRQGWLVAFDQLRGAMDASAAHVRTAAGGPEAVRTFPLARRVLAELERHRIQPATASNPIRLAQLRQAWMAIDATMATLGEIRFEARQRLDQPQKQQAPS